MLRLDGSWGLPIGRCYQEAMCQCWCPTIEHKTALLIQQESIQYITSKCIWYLYYIWILYEYLVILCNIHIIRLTSHPFDEGGFKDTQKISPCVYIYIYIYNILVLEKTVSKTRHTRLHQNPIRFRKSSSRFFDGDFYWAGIPRWTKPDIKLWVKLRNPYKSHCFYQHFWTKTAKVSQSWGRQTNHWFSLGQT